MPESPVKVGDLVEHRHPSSFGMTDCSMGIVVEVRFFDRTGHPTNDSIRGHARDVHVLWNSGEIEMFDELELGLIKTVF